MRTIWGLSPDDDSDRGAAAAAMRRMQPPSNEVPVVVPLGVVAHRSPRVAVALTGARVYSTGVVLDGLLARSTEGDTRPVALSELVFGHGFPDPDEGLLVGVELADGRTASAVGYPDPLSATPDRPVLTEVAGSGGEEAVEVSYWLSPLPPPGPLTVVLMCTALDLPETHVTLDATPFDRARSGVLELWPWTPPPSYDAPPPRLPEGSWFAAHVPPQE